MEYTTLGRTGLKVSVMGLGGGGPSRLGQRDNKSTAESVTILRQGLDAGINFIDTAEGYGTEGIVGEAIKSVGRDNVVISTKKSVRKEMTVKDVEESLEASLQRLGTDYIDIYNLHGVIPGDYEWLLQDIVPALLKFQEQGKVRFLGVTEMFNQDTDHKMSLRALQDDMWDVFMIGFNILNQSARDQVLAQAIEKDIGIQVMFAVRKAFSNPERLNEVIQELLERGQLDPEEIDADNPLGFLVSEGHATGLVDAAYRFCRDEPGTHVILSGTGNPAHLQSNIESLTAPPLPEAVTERLKHIFRNVDSVTAQ
jgi:aryl-alcohol dehydrogenase-like predicted oxidoreductase